MKALRMLLAVAVVLGVVGMMWADAGKGEKPKPKAEGLRGIVVKVEGTNLVIKVRQKEGEPKEVTVATDEKTEVMLDGKAAKLADLKPEMRVMVTPETGTAEKVRATSKGLEGAVVKVDGKNVVVKAGRGDEAKEVTVVTDEKTKVYVGDKAGKLEDLKADMRVTVIPETGTAQKIIAMMMGGRPPREAPKEEPKK